MEITLYLLLLTVIVVLFTQIKHYQNPFLFIGILLLSSFGLILSVSSDAYIQTGTITQVTDSTADNFTVESEPIRQDLGAWQYILTLFYLVSIIGVVVFWSFGEEQI